MKITAIKGVKDILPEVVGSWQFTEKEIRRLLEINGFSEIKIPLFETTELFARGIGEATDIVEKEMYTFEDRDGKKITLRPEGTASVVRAYIEHRLYEGNPLIKLYYIGPMFRHERPQAGRLRQFYQVGAEILGTQDPLVDVELLTLLHDLFAFFEIPKPALELNSVGCEVCRPPYKKALESFLSDSFDRLCANCQRRFTLNPLRILDCKQEGCQEITRKAPSIQSFLCQSCAPHFQAVLEGLSLLNIPYTINNRLVRGLDYYTKTAFEFTSESLGAQNAVAAGGRYDGLVEALGGPATPGIGFALGMERLISLLKRDLFHPPSIHCFIAVLGEKAQKTALLLATQLRRKGVRVEIDHQGGSLKSQMRRADKQGARYVMMLGDQEIKSGRVTVRDMEKKVQAEVELASLPMAFKSDRQDRDRS
jgi:histidyl-tRNA synthetase